ncbi:MAG: lactate permease LctP family transporter [Negativicutes bacterium]|nr:lactate permease LctP family transporter [Negativicutes bacterium]
MTWVQVYNPFGNIGLSALVAALPLFILFYMLAIRRTPGHIAALVSTIAAILVAIVAWSMPANLAIHSLLVGVIFSFFPIIWIIIAAMWVYNMTVEAGEFEIIKSSLAAITPDRRLQAILIAFAFGAFMEGTAGAGTSVAIAAAMLVGLGFQPMYAIGVCMIANTVPVAFGAIGTPIIVAGQVTGIDLMSISKIVGRQLPMLSVFVPLWMCIMMVGWKKAIDILPLIMFSGVVFAATQFLLSNFHGPYLPDILSAMLTIVALVVVLRHWKPANIYRFPGEPNDDYCQVTGCTSAEIVRAWGPYAVLAVMVFLWGLGSVKAVIGNYDYVINWPWLHNLVVRTAPIVAKDAPYGAAIRFSWVTSPGTAIFIAGLISLLFLPNYGFSKGVQCFGRTFKQMMKPLAQIAMILGLAFVMNYSGMSNTLGLAFAASGSLFPFFSPILGWVGVFLTGGDSGSNALFGSLQQTTAQQIGVNPALTVAANSSGGVAAKMISPQSLAVACAATGTIGEEGAVLRMTLPHSVAMCLILAVITYLQAYALSWMLP